MKTIHLKVREEDLANFEILNKNEISFDELLKYLRNIEDGNILKQTNDINTLDYLEVSIEDELNLEKLMKEQNFQYCSKEDMDEIIEKANLVEPLDQLLKMI